MTSLLPLPVMDVLKWVVPLCTGALIVLTVVSLRRQRQRLQTAVIIGLGAVSLLGLVDYTANSVRFERYFNYYEFYHYYIGTKYADELGYTHMYAASIVAESELREKKHRARRVRDLASGRHIDADRVRADAERYRSLFEPERWTEFKKDIGFFMGRVSRGQWHKQLMDKGYNASPVWTMVSGTLANLVPTDSKVGMQTLALLDVLLLLGTLGLVAWAFGPRPALLVLLMLTTHYVTSHTHQKAAFLRTDWVCCLVASICFLKKGWFKTAGALTAYAFLARLFPAVFVFGIGAKLLHVVWSERRVDHRYFSYCLSFAAVVAALVTVSAAVTSPGYWLEFIEKIRFHNDSITAWRIGFKYVFMMTWDGRSFGGASPLEFFQAWKLLWWGIQAVVLAVSFRLVVRLQDHEAQAYGFILVFFLVAPTYYYYIVLLVPTLYLAARLDDPFRAGALVYLFGTSVVANALHKEWDRSYPLFFTLSVLMLIFVLWLMFLAWRDGRRTQHATLAVP